MSVPSFSSQRDGERSGRQLIIHYNYKTPINPDIDSAIDPDQHVRRKEGEAEAHNHTEAPYSLYLFFFATAVFFSSSIFHTVCYECVLRCCSTKPEQLSATERCF